jgi:ferredoxin
MVMALDDVFVLQCPVSNALILQNALMDGLRYNGAAVFCVYEGNRDNQPGLSTYLNGASATESRVFPAFTYDPGRGDTLFDRVSLDGNPHLEDHWSKDEFSYVNSDDQENTVKLAFTPADFLFGDVRLARHFWRIPPDRWHPAMVTVDEYIELDPEDAETAIPYITGVGTDGRVVRIVVTRAVLGVLETCASFWRNTQENGGVNNSFVDNALSDEKKRLENEKQEEVEAIKKKFDSQLGRNIGELTREVVQRIVNQIVYGGGIGTDAPPTPIAAQPAPATDTAEAAPEDAPAAEAEVEEEEDEAIAFDDPFIDTPLCTTCNECTNLNGQMFAYNENKQAFIKDASAGTFRELVTAAEKCPVHIIHPGKPLNPDEPGLDELIQRAAKYN